VTAGRRLAAEGEPCAPGVPWALPRRELRSGVVGVRSCDSVPAGDSAARVSRLFALFCRSTSSSVNERARNAAALLMLPTSRSSMTKRCRRSTTSIVPRPCTQRSHCM
jgi:hypothetical protein